MVRISVRKRRSFGSSLINSGPKWKKMLSLSALCMKFVNLMPLHPKVIMVIFIDLFDRDWQTIGFDIAGPLFPEIDICKFILLMIGYFSLLLNPYRYAWSRTSHFATSSQISHSWNLHLLIGFLNADLKKFCFPFPTFWLWSLVHIWIFYDSTVHDTTDHSHSWFLVMSLVSFHYSSVIGPMVIYLKRYCNFRPDEFLKPFNQRISLLMKHGALPSSFWRHFTIDNSLNSTWK